MRKRHSIQDKLRYEYGLAELARDMLEADVPEPGRSRLAGCEAFSLGFCAGVEWMEGKRNRCQMIPYALRITDVILRTIQDGGRPASFARSARDPASSEAAREGDAPKGKAEEPKSARRETPQSRREADEEASKPRAERDPAVTPRGGRGGAQSGAGDGRRE